MTQDRSATPNRYAVLQICNHYEAPFLDVTRQYAALFPRQPAEVVTVFLRGKPDTAVMQAGIGHAVFLELSKAQVRGLKREAIRRIRELDQQYHFRFCIAHRYHPTKIATQAGKFPVLAVHHRFGTYSRWERRFYINRHQSQLTLLNVSNAVRDETRAFLPRWPESRIQTFYNHVDLTALEATLLSRNEARRKLDLPDDAFVIANVGRLHKDKDQKTLLHGFAKALPHLPAATYLAIYGKGPLEEQLKEQAQQLGLADRVIFGGFVDNLSCCFKAFDVFALTSDHEPFGMVLLEAMTAGIPVICSDCGGGKEVVGENSQLFPLGDADVLALRLRQQAELTTTEHEKLVAAQRLRVQNIFSDTAAENDFWKRFDSLLPTGNNK